jgi:hypothetical protein
MGSHAEHTGKWNFFHTPAILPEEISQVPGEGPPTQLINLKLILE